MRNLKCIAVYGFMKLWSLCQDFFLFGKGVPVVRNLSPPTFLFPPFPYLLSLSVKDEDCEALFTLLVVAGLLGGMRSKCQEHLVMSVGGRQKPPRPCSLHLELSVVICSSAGKYEALRDWSQNLNLTSLQHKWLCIQVQINGGRGVEQQKYLRCLLQTFCFEYWKIK